MEQKMNDLSNSRVLVVDDTEANIDILVDVLSKYYQISVAMDGETALQDIPENIPDLILLDIMMPGIDGYEVCRQLKANPEYKNIPIIFLTAMTETENIVKGFDLGAVDYITKPFNLTELLRRVKTHLELKNTLEEIENQNKKLLKAAKFREDVDMIIRHDLKTPLNPIIGYPQILKQQEDLTENGKKYLRIIEESGFRMLNMINLSLDLFKMEQGVYHLKSAPVDILQIVENVKLELSELIQSKKISLNVTLFGLPGSEQQQFLITGEELLCYSMLANLVKNALEASPEHESVTIEGHKKDEKTAIIRIHNKGTVPADVQSTFFDKYTTSGKREGTGLGTYSAKLMARTLNGQISMTTSETEGTYITVELPIAEG